MSDRPAPNSGNKEILPFNHGMQLNQNKVVILRSRYCALWDSDANSTKMSYESVKENLSEIA